MVARMLVRVFSTVEKCADLVVPALARIALHPRLLVGVVEHVSRVFGLRSFHHILFYFSGSQVITSTRI